MSEVVEKLIDETIDCNNIRIIKGDEVEIIKRVGGENIGLTGLRGKVYTIKHCIKDEKEWITVSMQDSDGTVIGLFNSDFRKVKNCNSKYSEEIMEQLRQRRDLDKYDTSQDEDINNMNKDDVFYDLFVWNGLLGWDRIVKDWVEEVYCVKLSDESEKE